MCVTASFLATGSFVLIISKCIHDLQACLFKYITVLLLYSAFMLSGVKMLLKGEVGGHTLKIVMESALLTMENHGIVFLNFCGNPE